MKPNSLLKIKELTTFCQDIGFVVKYWVPNRDVEMEYETGEVYDHVYNSGYCSIDILIHLHGKELRDATFDIFRETSNGSRILVLELDINKIIDNPVETSIKEVINHVFKT